MARWAVLLRSGMIGALAALVVLGADGGVPQVLISRQTLIQMYMPVERDTWTLRLNGSQAWLERVSEIACSMAPSLRPALGSTVRAVGAQVRRRCAAAAGARALCPREPRGLGLSEPHLHLVVSADLRCQCPARAAPKHFACGEGELVWASTKQPKALRVAECSVTGLDDLPYWGATLTFLLAPGVEHVTEEDSCLGGEGLRLL